MADLKQEILILNITVKIFLPGLVLSGAKTEKLVVLLKKLFVTVTL